jgi:hypothetical protein
VIYTLEDLSLVKEAAKARKAPGFGPSREEIDKWFSFAGSSVSRRTKVEDMICGHCQYQPAWDVSDPYVSMRTHLRRMHASSAMPITIMEVL